MRLPLTGPKTRRWFMAVATAFSLATVALAAPARASSSNGASCQMTTPRVRIPSNFTVDACFDGKVLTLRNTTSVALRVYAQGDYQWGVRNADLPSVATMLTTIITENDIIPPGSYLQLGLGPGEADIQMEVALVANRDYDLYELLLGYLPGDLGSFVGGYNDVAEAEESISAAFANRERCEAGASWLADIKCVAIMTGSIYKTAQVLLAKLGLDLAHNIGVLTAGLVNTAWYLFSDSQQQLHDLSVIADSTTTLHVAAASGTAAGSGSGSGNGGGGGAASGPVSATASSSSGQLMVQLTNFPLGATYYFCHSGSGYPTGGTIASHGSVSVASPDQNLGAVCSGSGNFWVGFQATDGHDYYSNQVSLTAPAQPAYHAGRQVTIDSHATGGVSGHTGPSNSYPVGPTHPVNSPIWLVCYVNGQSITGPYDTTTIWDLADDGYYYTDAWLYTGTNGPAVPPCAMKTVPVASQATGGVSGHRGPGNSYVAGPTHAANTPITIVCYVNGQSITGPYDTTTIWDLADDGYYYTDAWLYTGTNGPAVPAC